MAITATAVPQSGWVAGNKKIRYFDLTFANNYQDDGSETTLTAAQCGLKRFFFVAPQGGIAAASNLATGNPIAVTINAAGTSAELTFYEDLASAAAAPLGEKTDNEAFLTGQTIRVRVEGY